MGEAKNIYFTCLKYCYFSTTRTFLSFHERKDDALRYGTRKSRQVGESARCQLARALQEHPRSRRSHPQHAAQARYPIPQERYRFEGNCALQALRGRSRSSRPSQSLERLGRSGSLAQEVRRIPALTLE